MHLWLWGTTYGAKDGPGGPSMAAVLGPGGPSTATYFAADGPGDLFWGTICGITGHKFACTRMHTGLGT